MRAFSFATRVMPERAIITKKIRDQYKLGKNKYIAYEP